MSMNSPKTNEQITRSIDLLREFADKQIRANGVPVEFPESIAHLSEKDFGDDDNVSRLDLRNLECMTIDCDDTHDMDDAVSLEETPNGYRLGVHIADVASYVEPCSPLDYEAMKRGTSIYLPDRTIPMLPGILSEELCSLNPGADRRAISVMISIDKSGNVIEYSISKTLIRSRLKGVYSEVNDVLSGCADVVVARKYEAVEPILRKMAVLAGILRIGRMKRGADICDEGVAKVVLIDGDIELEAPYRGIAEKMIEEFMVLCNTLVGKYLEENHLPGIYRTQAALGRLAMYEADANRHASLEVDGYVHFTSPIRRMPDLKIHQCLTMHLDGVPAEAIELLFGDTIGENSELAAKRSRRAKNIEYACRKYCYSLYFDDHADATFTGRIVGEDKSGNGLLEIDNLRIRVIAPKGRQLVEGCLYSFQVCIRGFKRTAQACAVRRTAACVA